MRTVLSILCFLLAVQAHATNFTDVTAGNVYYTSNTIVNEIVISLRQRQSMFSQTESPDYVAPGTYVQNTNFWLPMQQWCSNNAGLFVNTQTNDFVGPANFLFHHTWQTVLNNINRTNGFRRARYYNPSLHDWTDPLSPMWTNYPGTNGYGFIRAGDIVGPWIVDDLQLALNEERLIRWDVGQGGDEEIAIIDGQRWYAAGGAEADSDDSYDAQVIAWTSTTFTNISSYPAVYVAKAYIDYDSAGTTWDYSGERINGGTIISAYYLDLAALGYSASVYYEPFAWIQGAPTNTTRFYDFDSQGWAGDGSWYYWGDYADSGAITTGVFQFDVSTNQPNPVQQIWGTAPSYTTASDTNINASIRFLRVLFTPDWAFERAP